MFNPFTRFENRFIPAFRKLNKRYLVSQTFTRENNLFKDPAKNYILLTHYVDEGLAQIHYNAVIKDEHASLLDLENEEERERVLSMININSAYVVYSSLIPDPKVIKDAADKIFKEKITKYLSLKTNWRIGADKTIVPTIEITFGELFVVIKFASQTVRPTLAEIESI